MSTSVVIICATEHLSAGNRFFVALGEDELPGHYMSVALSADGQAPATHYGCRTDASDELWTMLAGLKIGDMPASLATTDWAAIGTTEEDVLAFGLAMSLNADQEPQQNGAVFFGQCIGALGLSLV